MSGACWHAYKNTDLHMCGIYYSCEITNYETSEHVVSTRGDYEPIETIGTLHEIF